ncbi:KptA family-domain-containing protein, partial [Mycena galopus ATCC 62051]
SRELAYLLRHGAKSVGLPIRNDGYVEVDALLNHRTLRGLDFAKLETIVRDDQKRRYTLMKELRPGGSQCWLIRANQGHSMPVGNNGGLTRIQSASQIPMAVHGTSMKAWETISKQGLSRMSRNHIHLAQGTAGKTQTLLGMRASSEVLIFIDVERALEAGVEFYLSSNGVVLTPGNEAGFLEPRFFSQTERRGGGRNPGWKPAERGEMTAREAASDTGAIPRVAGA